MTLQAPNTVDAAREKHVPVTEKISGGVLVYIGSVEHPMLDNHYIELIELHTKNKLYRKHLKPRDKPKLNACLTKMLYMQERIATFTVCGKQTSFSL